MSQALASTAARAARSAAAREPLARGSRSTPASGQRPSVRRPPLRVVQAPQTAGSPLGFALICATLLATGLIALLLLNTAVAQDSFGLQRLQDNARALSDQKQALTQTNDLAASPQQLSARAWALGLVPSSGTAFIELPSGKVLGVANRAPAAKPPTVITSTIRTNGTTSSGSGPATTTAVVPGTAPGLAPAAPVSATAETGTGPATLAPAAPTSTTTGTTSATKSTAKSTTKTATPGTH
jgi:hypothetical protein